MVAESGCDWVVAVSYSAAELMGEMIKVPRELKLEIFKSVIGSCEGRCH